MTLWRMLGKLEKMQDGTYRVTQERKHAHRNWKIEPMAWGGKDQVSAAYNMRDPLPGIINNDSKLVGKQAIGSADDKISYFIR